MRIQKENETLEIVIDLMTHACKNNGYEKKILIKTNNLRAKQLFPTNTKTIKDIIIVDDVNSFFVLKQKTNNLHDLLENLNSNYD